MTDTREPAASSDIEFNYLKANEYRSVHVDGAVASTTPRGLVALTLYNERSVIARKTHRPIISQGEIDYTLGAEEPMEGLSGVVRELQVTAFLDLKTATEFRDMMIRVVEALTKLHGPDSHPESAQQEE